MKSKFTVFLFVLAIMFPLTIVATRALQKNEVTESNNTSSIVVEDNTVIPQESDFTFSGTTLTGISDTFVNGLSEIQKQNIRLVIPAKTTCIGNNAFWKNSGINQQCNYISLDFSMPTNLVEIKDNAFYGCSEIVGSLVLPDTVQSIGTHAFDGCSGLTGTLTLPNQITKISDYAFYNCGFKGTLSIPNTVGTIGASAFRQSNSYAGFSGSLVLPNSVTSIGTVAFSNQSSITSIVLSNQLTMIPQSAFKGTGLEGVLVLPDTIQQIDTSAFASTKLETVYLSKRKDSTNTLFIRSTSFNECNKLTAIICDKADYNYIYEALNTATKTKLGYPVTVHFNDGTNYQYPVIECLYKQSYQLQKDSSGKWSIHSNYTFPTVNNEPKKKWSLSKTSLTVVKETDMVEQDTLHAILPLENPIITFGKDIDKVYDGKETMLEVTASHPLAKKIDDATIGDVVFYYTWCWDTISSSGAVLQGFDENRYGVKDVREPRFAIGCSVEVMVCRVDNNYNTVPFYTTTHTFSVTLNQQESIVHPLYPQEPILLANGLPKIITSSGDTVGTLTFDKGQTLALGKHGYTWTFVPINNEVGNCNYTIVKGTIELEAVEKFTNTLLINKSNNGHVNVVNTVVERGSDVAINVVPDAGYTIEHLYIDKEEVTKDIKNNVYTLKNIQKDHTIKATFIPLPLEDVEDIITDMPIITDGVVSEEQREEVLNTVEYFLTLDKDVQDKIPEKTKHMVYQTMAKLPQIQMAVPQSNATVLENEMLLQTLTAQEVEILLHDKDAILTMAVNINEVVPTKKQQEEIATVLQDGNVCQTLDIDIEKALTSHGDTQSTNITNLSIPMQFSFIPPATMPTLNKGYVRSMFIIRIHEQGDTVETTILEDENKEDDAITISTDRFSCYVLAYKDTFVEQPSVIVPPTSLDKPNSMETPTIVESSLKKQNTTSHTATGDISLIGYSEAMLLGSLVGIVVCIMKKK